MSKTTLLAEHEGRDYAEIDDGRGKIRFWHLANRICIFESSGNLQGDHVRFLIGKATTHIEAFPRPWLAFGNWSHLLAYTPEVRKLLTDWQVAKRYEELYVSHNSKMVAMSISVANSVLPTTIQVLPTEEHLDDVLIAVRKRLGI